MKLLYIFFMLSFYIPSYGQTKYDSINSSECVNKYNIIDTQFPLQKNNDIEFRLWTNSDLIGYSNLFVMVQKNGKWSARFFEYSIKKGWKENPTKQDKLDSLWKRLVNNKVLSLPDQMTLWDRMKTYKADSSFIEFGDDGVYNRMMVEDGVIYIFQVFTKDSQRTYSYDNPVTYLKVNTNIEELYRAYALISLVRKYLGLSLAGE